MKKEGFGVRIENIESVDIAKIDLSEENQKALGFNPSKKKEPIAIEKILGEKEYRIYDFSFILSLKKSITEEQKKNCLHCGLHKEVPEHDKLCSRFRMEGSINFIFAHNEFISILNQNNHLYSKDQLKILAKAFFHGFKFYKGRVFFNRSHIIQTCLKQGLLSISEKLSQSSIFDRMKIINESTRSLRHQQTFFEINNGKKSDIIEFQLDFYNTEKQYYQQDKYIESNYKKNTFSILEWTAIFYYALDSGLLAKEKNLIESFKKFIEKHQIKTTTKSFKSKYYQVKKRINHSNDFSIEKLEKIIPFLKEEYPKVVTKVENDIKYLKEENTSY